MYKLISKYVPEPWSAILAAIWYLLLIYLIYYCSAIPEADFRYMNL